MLRSVKDIRGYGMHTTDGDIGRAYEFYWDDETWTIRYIVVDTRNWWPGKKVLVSPPMDRTGKLARPSRWSTWISIRRPYSNSQRMIHPSQ
jgi:hypothetical protein